MDKTFVAQSGFEVMSSVCVEHFHDPGEIVQGVIAALIWLVAGVPETTQT